MAKLVFNLSNLRNVYVQALHSPDMSLVFEIVIGNGHFLFMMFLSPDDTEMHDYLFVYMRNTRRLEKTKTYGSHRKGKFTLYINNELKQHFIDELQLQPGNNEFSFLGFLTQVNNAIPNRIDFREKIKVLRDNRNLITKIGGVDDAEKTILMGPMHLSVGTPRDRTLRKLYAYTEGDPEEIDELIKTLKELNVTLRWTTPEKAAGCVNISKMIVELKKRYA
jgi:hypothetical protein